MSTFEHSFDAKGRVTVPAEWRTAGHEPSLHVFPSAEGCLKVYPASWLAEQLAKMSGLKADDPQRRQLEALASLAQPAEVDAKTGRMIIREGLRRHASLTKEAVLVGRGLYFQVWDKAKHAALPRQALTLEDALAAAGL